MSIKVLIIVAASLIVNAFAEEPQQVAGGSYPRHKFSRLTPYIGPQMADLVRAGSNLSEAEGERLMDEIVHGRYRLHELRESLLEAAAMSPEEKAGPYRFKRQISMPSAPAAPANGGLGGFLSNIGPQVDQVKAFSSLFNFAGPAQPAAQPAASPSASQIISQVSELVRATQDRNAKAAAGAQQEAANQSASAVQSAQTGLQAALTEMVQGIQKLAATNPNLLPEVKSLYSNVSSKLSSSATSLSPQPMSSAITPAKSADQLADNLAKVALPGLQTPA